MTKKGTSKKKRQGGIGIFALFIGLLVFLAAAAGLFYAFDKNKPEDLSDESVKVFDLTDRSKTAHKTIDDILLQKTEHWQLRDIDRKDRSEKLPATGGEVTWNQREAAVGVPASTDLAGAAKWVAERLRNTDLQVINEGEATWNKMDAYRLDIGIAVKSGKDSTRTFVTDSVYFFHHGNLTNKDKDIPKPEKKQKEISGSAKHHGKLSVVIDDCGYDNGALKELLATRLPFSYAIIPYKAGSSEALRMIKAQGRTAMLHLPMEPIDRGQMSEGSKTIMVAMSDSEETAAVKEALASLPGVSGVNNHQGSRATGDKQTMDVLLKVLKEQGLFFIDSHTSSQSVGYERARKMGVPTNRNELFLDNEASTDAIYARIKEAMGRADRDGGVVVICHARSVTARTWTLYLDEIKKTGIQIVPIQELLQ